MGASSGLPGWDFAALAILPQDDEREAAADRTARRIMRGQPSGIPGDTAAEGLPSGTDLRTGTAGAPLDPDTRRFFEQRLGWSLGRVRVHTDEVASRTADALGAAAVTVGSDIAFARRRYEPGIERGRALLAHELVHVAQQAAGPPVVALQRVEQYETRGIPIDAAVIRQQSNLGYWNLKLRAAGFIPSMDIPTGARLAIEGEERNAVLSTVFQIRPQPATMTQDLMKLVTVPKRATAKDSHDVTYQVTFEARPRPDQTSRAVTIVFVAKDKGATAVAAESAPTNYTPKNVRVDEYWGFPKGGPEPYWKAHRDEERRVFRWIELSAAQEFDQVITATSDGAVASFHVKGEKDPSGKVSKLLISFLGAAAPQKQVPAADYRSRDFSDKAVEDAQTARDPLLNDKLGTISGLDSKHAEEHGPVKFAIVEYFSSQSSAGDPTGRRTGTRNAEVDAIVPIPRGGGMTTNRRVLYTFRFKPNSRIANIQDVDVQRIGEEGVDAGVGASATPKGRLARVNGFAEHAIGATEEAQVKSLIDWLKERYKGVTPAAATTIAALEKDVNAQIRAGSKDPKWFDANYGIRILTADEARVWLDKSLGLHAQEDLRDLLDFRDDELPLLEYALEKMSDGTLSRFRGLRFVRQKVFFKFVRAGVFEEMERVAGVTRGGATTRTITMFDAATDNPDSLFLGGVGSDGKPMTVPGAALPLAHELGHVVSHDPGVQRAFDKLVVDKGIRPITWYAGSDPPNELFPEAFALYYGDPEWLKNDWPDLFNFFEALDKKPPPTKKASTPTKAGRGMR